MIIETQEELELTKLTGANLVYLVKSHKDAILERVRDTDAGYDINLVGISKQVGDVVFFQTGIKLQPPPGYYFEIVPRSSISKTDWMLANSLGIIDQEYRGELLVPMRKMKPDAEPLNIPGRYVQLIFRKQEDPVFFQVEELNETSRGANGFGSSGN